MKKEWSKRLRLDLRNLKDIAMAIIVWILSFYAANAEALNWIIQKYVGESAFAIITMVLAYFCKKLLTDYSDKWVLTAKK